MDHIKLAKERDRMCDSMGNRCHPKPCPMRGLEEKCEKTFEGDCLLIKDYCRFACMRYPEETDAIISKWSAENPEPRYPTWREWFLTFLPEVPIALLVRFRLNGPCDIHLHEGVVEVTCCGRESSEYKLNVPIPADVAEMLKVSMITQKGAAT